MVNEHGNARPPDDHTVVGRAVAILDVVSESALPVNLAELTRLTGIPKPTTHRIANDLVARGMLERTATGYRTGSRLLKQGLNAAIQRGYVTAAQPILLDLHQRARGEVAWFGTFNDGDFQPVIMNFGVERAAAVERMMPAPTFATLGSSMVLSSAGRLLTTARPELAEYVRRHGCRPLTRYSVIEGRRLASLLDEAADTGFAHELEEGLLGCSCAGALVRDSAGAIAGVVGVASFSGRTDPRKLRSSLLDASTALQAEFSTPQYDELWTSPTGA